LIGSGDGEAARLHRGGHGGVVAGVLLRYNMAAWARASVHPHISP
jgi:hypothetical protein